ncbi:MAG: DNA sulfur modification protein DndD [Lachnospiraceae bacterium]|nr:DNA sulfur modification protein DndD [Lachnospiraceae bacterium]
MLIKSLRYKNFRQFKGENKIDFSADPEKNVTIILGDNTFGKTTLLQMFNWCFYDKAIFNDNPDFLLNLELASGMYNDDDPIEVLIEIVLSHEGRDYTITRKQDYLKVNGKVIHRDSKLKVSFKDLSTGKTGYIEKDKDMKSVINLILPEDLSGYFFFDTERVQNVADRKDLSSSVKGLLGLTVLDNALKHLGKEESKTTVIGSFYEDLKKNDDSKATEALAEIQAAEETRAYQQKIKDDAEAEIDNYERRREVLEGKIRDLQATTDLQKRKDQLTRDIKSEKEALEKVYSEFPILFGDDAVWFFAQPLYRQAMEFLEQADVDDKGISDVTANTIKELIKNGRCLCGAEVKDGNDAYLHLMEQIKFVPPESIGTTIKNFKKDIAQYDKINLNDRFFITIQSRIADILRFKNRIQEWEEEIAEIETEIEGKEDAKKYQIELNDVKTRLKEKTKTKELAIAKIAEAESRKERFKKIYDTLIAKSDKGREIRRYLAYAEKIQEWIQGYYQTEESKIRSELQEHVNTIFQRMYHGERELEINEKYQTVLYTIIPETKQKVISGESEGLLRVKNFAFIAGLVDLAKDKALKVGDNRLENEPYPLILDAPFSNADEEHIKNISRELPMVAEQVIMFVMKKDWRYAETVILDRVNKMYTLEKHSDTYSTIS